MQLPLSFSLPAAVLATLIVPSLTLADPGILDRYECHNDRVTGEYHCHRDWSSLPDRGRLAIGAGLRSSVWFLSANDDEVFVGPSIDIEAGLDEFAVQVSFHDKQLISGDDEMDLVGWDIGVKIGPGVAQYGSKYYGTLGYFAESLQQQGNEDANIRGFYVGAGGGYNWDEVGLDIQADWDISEGFREFANVDVQTFSIRSVLSYRF